jgi:hypothetical protein
MSAGCHPPTGQHALRKRGVVQPFIRKNKITVTGYVSNADLPSYYSVVDVVVRGRVSQCHIQELPVRLPPDVPLNRSQEEGVVCFNLNPLPEKYRLLKTGLLTRMSGSIAFLNFDLSGESHDHHEER